MPDWTQILLLGVQAAFTIVTVEQLRRHVFGAISQMSQPALIVDVWGPIAVALPMLFMVGRIEGNVEGEGWIAIGMPGMVAIVSLGAALLVARDAVSEQPVASTGSIVNWSGTGLILLLLGAAHDLTILMGQCAFGAAAMLLWINSPDEPASFEGNAGLQTRAGLGMTIAFTGAIGQGLTAYFIDPRWAHLSGGMMVGGAVMAVASAAAFAGSAAAIRLGGWAATYGVLFALGLLSLVRLMPNAWQVLFDGKRGVAIDRIAYGFGSLWIESFALLLFGFAALVSLHFRRSVRQMIGFFLLLVAAVLAGWRLSHI